MNYLDHFSEMISLRGLRESTRRTYTTYISAYLHYASNIVGKRPEDLSWHEMRSFVHWIQGDRNLSDRTVNYVIAQLRFFTLYVLHQPWDPYQLPYRKFDQYVPFVPSRREVSALINAIDDRKARMMVILMYSSGLRIGEVCNLRYEDISRANMNIHITHGKNRQDRYAILSPAALAALTSYWYMYGRPTEYLFHQKGFPNKPVSTSYVSHKINNAEESLGWPHRFTCHTLRHAFATHFYEDYGDLLALKELLGHRSINSTTIYVTLSGRSLKKYESPIESLEFSL